MKKLKKLSVVFMIATLFSASFTSCIDNEVSPLVEAIYQNQAALIAAQTTVQNAEAALLDAQAAQAEANAAWNLANAAQVDAYTAGVLADNAYEALQREQFLLELIAQTNLDVAAAENALALANMQFEIDMAALVAELEEAGLQLAIEHALSYRFMMNAANDILYDKLQAEADLANAQLLQTEDDDDNIVSWAYALAHLEAAVTSKATEITNLEASIADMAAVIAAMQANIDDNSPIRDAIAALEVIGAGYDDDLAANTVAQAEQQNIIDAIYDEYASRNELIIRYEEALADLEYAQGEKEDLEDDIEGWEDDIEGWELALADYPTALSDAEQVVSDAEQAVTDAWEALGEEDANDDTPAFGNYFEVDADNVALAAGGTKYDPASNLQEELVNARITMLDAWAAKNAYTAELAALTASYNAAAVALADAQNAFDAQTYDDDLIAAQDDLSDAQDDLSDAQDDYDAAFADFSADPTGFTVADGSGNHSSGDFDFGNTGIAGDGETRTFMQVGSVGETSVGSGNYEVKSLLPTKYVFSELEGVADAATVAYTDAFIWEDNAQMPVTDLLGTVLDSDVHRDRLETTPDALPFVVAIDTGARLLFVEVESDDTSVSKLYTFNVATNMLGLDDFSTRVQNIVAPNYLVAGSNSASYDISPNTDGEADGGTWALTAYAVAWNAELAVAIAQEAFDTGDDALIAAQEEFDRQQVLFDEGAATEAGLLADAENADTAKADAEGLVDDAWGELGGENADGVAGDAMIVDAETLNDLLFNAQVALADLEVCDATCLQDNIDDANDDIDDATQAIAVIEPIIAAKQAVVDGLQDAYDEFIANEGYLSSLYADLHAELIAAYQVLWTLEEEADVIADQDGLNDDLITAYGTAEDNTTAEAAIATLVTALDGLETTLADCIADLELATEIAEQALASGQADAAAAEAYIAYLEALVDTLEQRYQNALALANGYKDLMDAAIAG